MKPARAELARAERVAALNEREEKRSELEKIVGETPEVLGALAVLRPTAVAPRPQPDDVRAWIE
jgi:outer membrane protein TolC